jgi:hypothetical protein
MLGGVYSRFGWTKLIAAAGSPEGMGGGPPLAPALTVRMRHMHTLLIHVFQHVVDSHRRCDFDACLVHLDRFDRELRAYLGHERAELEDYMILRFGSDAAHLLTMRQVRARLRRMAREVHEMLQPPHPSRADPARNPDFHLMFEAMAKNLGDCVDTSELELLPLCHPEPGHEPWIQAREHVERGHDAAQAAAARSNVSELRPRSSKP